MDFNFWTRRMHSAKHTTVVQAARLSPDDHLILVESETAFFPCPFCYVEIEACVFCTHLQEEHCFGLESAVCPLCAEDLGRDAIGHFVGQHAQSVKWRQKSQKSEFSSNNLSNFNKEPQEFCKYLGSNSQTIHEPVFDPLFSPFISSITLADPSDKRKNANSGKVAESIHVHNTERSGPFPPRKGHDRDNEKERTQRVDFVQQLIAATIFRDFT